MDITNFVCSKCRKPRPPEDFDLNKQGKRKSLCNRHTKKRSLQRNNWDEFTTLLSNWNQQSQPLSHDFEFDLDALPVNFGSEFDKGKIRIAMHDLSNLIWNQGGFRFRHTSTDPRYYQYRYHCSQDEAHTRSYQSKVEVEKQIDGRCMKRFPCGSKLLIQPSLLDRTLRLSIQHHWHPPYRDLEVPQVIRDLIDSLVLTHAPAEISRQIREHPKGKEVSRHQVYYIWQKANSKNWRRHDDSN